MTVTIYHAGMQGDYENFHLFTHFATEIQPCINVAGRKYFSDRKPEDNWMPTLYTCEVELDVETQLELWEDKGSPRIQAFANHWRQRYRHDLEKYKEVSKKYFWDTDDEELTAWLREETARAGVHGYRYENRVEGGVGVCLVDASDVRIIKREPIPMDAVANVFLGLTAHQVFLNEERYEQAKAEALGWLSA